jgi:hypothetical protein
MEQLAVISRLRNEVLHSAAHWKCAIGQFVRLAVIRADCSEGLHWDRSLVLAHNTQDCRLWNCATNQCTQPLRILFRRLLDRIIRQMRIPHCRLNLRMP